MDRYANKIIMAIVFLLAFDLWGVHAKLLYQLNPDKVGSIAQTFSYVAMNENTITAMLFALVFAFVPVLVLTTISPKLEQYWLFVTLFAFFDGGAWFIYYNKTAIAHFETFGAGYYGLFIVFIVASVGFIRMRLDELQDKEQPVDTSFVDEEFIKERFKEMYSSPGISTYEYPATNISDNDVKDVVDKLNEVDRLVHMVSNETPQKTIAKTLNWHPSKVSRTIKKLKEDGKIKT